MYSNIVAAIESGANRMEVDIPTPPVPPRNYYISAAGSGDGTTSGTPGPLSLLTSATLNRGDSIYFNKGDSFNLIELEVNVDDISFNAFGTGANPILRGSGSALTSWTNVGGGIYSKVTSAPKWVYDAGVSAKQAESPWYEITANVSTSVRRVLAATINALPSSIVGASIVAKEFSFRLSKEFTVTAYNSTNGNITFTGTGSMVNATVGMPLKLSNQRQFMTANGDWSYESGTLYVQSASAPTTVAIGNAEYAIIVNNASGVSIQNIDFRNYYKYSVYGVRADDLSITNCNFINNRGQAFRISRGSNFVFENNNVEKCALRGGEVSGVLTGSIANNTFLNIGDDANLGRPFDDSKSGGTCISIVTVDPLGTYVPKNLTIENNVMHDFGYCGTLLWGPDHIVRNNHIYNYCSKWSDGGAVYYYYANNLGLDDTTSNCLTQSNVIHDGIGSIEGITSGAILTLAAVYHDSGIDNCTIDSNFIYLPGAYGIFTNAYNTAHIVTNNMVSGATVAQVRFSQSTSANAIYDYTTVLDCVFTGNTLVCSLNGNVRCIIMYGNSGTFLPFDTIDNNHYVQPYTTIIAARTSNNGLSYSTYTLAQWRTNIGGDAASTTYNNYKVTSDPDDVKVFTNVTASPTSENIPGGYTTVTGSAPSNPYSLDPYEGLIYLHS